MYYFVLNSFCACAYTTYTREIADKCTKKTRIMLYLFVDIDFFYKFVRSKPNILI